MNFHHQHGYECKLFRYPVQELRTTILAVVVEREKNEITVFFSFCMMPNYDIMLIDSKQLCITVRAQIGQSCGINFELRMSGVHS